MLQSPVKYSPDNVKIKGGNFQGRPVSGGPGSPAGHENQSLESNPLTKRLDILIVPGKNGF
jgi:hypothetical protein